MRGAFIYLGCCCWHLFFLWIIHLVVSEELEESSSIFSLADEDYDDNNLLLSLDDSNANNGIFSTVEQQLVDNSSPLTPSLWAIDDADAAAAAVGTSDDADFLLANEQGGDSCDSSYVPAIDFDSEIGTGLEIGVGIEARGTVCSNPDADADADAVVNPAAAISNFGSVFTEEDESENERVPEAWEVKHYWCIADEWQYLANIPVCSEYLILPNILYKDRLLSSLCKVLTLVKSFIRLCFSTT